MWFIKKKSADHALEKLVDGLSKVLGQKLASVLIYGSKASGEFREDFSDVNVFILLQDASDETLGLMAPSLRAWLKAGHPMPVFIQKSELQIYANSLPIEFLDMQDHHKVIFGSNPLQDLKVDRSTLRAQCAQELSIKLLKIRQGILLADGNAKRLRELLLESVPSVLTLYRAALRLEAEVPKGNKILAAKELAKRAGFDEDCLERLWDFHMRRQSDNIADLAEEYVRDLERVLVYISKR